MVKSIFILILAILFQPLLKVLNSLIWDSTLTAGIISSISTIFGNVVGGIIGAIVAFSVARYQIKQDNNNENTKKLEENHQIYQTIAKEIELNNKVLQLIKLDTSAEDLESMIKYSLSDRVFSSVKANLSIDANFSKLHRYYRLLYRVQNDPILLKSDNIIILLDEIEEIVSIEFNFDPTTK